MYLQYLCKVVSCELPSVCVCHLGLLLGDFICHGRCPYTTTPRGEIRHAAWLSLPLPIYHCFSTLFKCPALLPLSSSTFPPFSCHQCLCPPSHSLHLPSPPSISPSALHWAMAVNRLQESRQGLHQDPSCRAQEGLCVHSAGLLTSYSMEIGGGFQSLPSTEAHRSASKIMSDNDAL